MSKLMDIGILLWEYKIEVMYSATLTSWTKPAEGFVEDRLYVMITFLVCQVIFRFITSLLGEGDGK